MTKYIKNNLSLPLQTYLIGSFLTLATLRKLPVQYGAVLKGSVGYYDSFYRRAPNKTRAFSTKSSGDNSNNLIKPVVIYDNADTLKDQIIADNKNRSGVYR